MKPTIFLCGSFLFLTVAWPDPGQEGSEPVIVQQYNREAAELKEQLKTVYDKASQLVRDGANEANYLSLIEEMKSIKKEKDLIQEKWRKSFADDAGGGDDNYALWDMGETTLSQLIMEYGASDYLYIIPPELSSMKISLFSSIPLPRESWGEMMEMILIHNGVGAKKLNAWVKQLYILKLDPSAIEGIVSREEDLALVDPHARIFYVFSPKAEQIKSIQGFFERFSDPRQTTVQSIASKIVLVSTRETVEKLIGLYRAVWQQDRGKVVRLINLLKIAPAEAEKVLKAVFSDSPNKARSPLAGFDDLFILPLPQGLVLAGDAEAVQRGEKITRDLEEQLEDPSEKVISWYSCKHSNPEDIAAILTQVYDSLIGVTMEKKEAPTSPIISSPPPSTPLQEPCPSPIFPCPNSIYSTVNPVNPGFVQPGMIDQQKKSVFGNFVVDAKTSSILMVVRREELSKIKTLLKKLDVPKRMVQIDVLLVEKRMQDRRQVGINLLNINSNLKGPEDKPVPHEIGVSFQKCEKGLLQFLFKKPPGNFPGVDLAYNFLLAQDDLRINANPSILAINQTPAQISIVDEISINNGAIVTSSITNSTEKSYTRTQYGTTILMLPTIHLPDPEEKSDYPGFVTLHTDVTFDTPPTVCSDDRPPVVRRHVTNDVQIADGETVILGGLRRKTDEDSREKIPFLGDLPGIGKLFGIDKAIETSTEMYIFITPHIIHDPIDDLRCLRQEEYRKRAGEIPEFLTRLDEAKEKERNALFSNSLKMLFDRF